MSSVGLLIMPWKNHKNWRQMSGQSPCPTAVWQAVDVARDSCTHAGRFIRESHFTFSRCSSWICSFLESAKYIDLLLSHLFQPTAVETLHSLDSSTATFFVDLGHEISLISIIYWEASFLFQHSSITRQCFNLVLFVTISFQWWHRGPATPALLQSYMYRAQS